MPHFCKLSNKLVRAWKLSGTVHGIICETWCILRNKEEGDLNDVLSQLPSCIDFNTAKAHMMNNTRFKCACRPCPKVNTGLPRYHNHNCMRTDDRYKVFGCSGLHW
jgi:hypothetical protein